MESPIFGFSFNSLNLNVALDRTFVRAVTTPRRSSTDVTRVSITFPWSDGSKALDTSSATTTRVRDDIARDANDIARAHAKANRTDDGMIDRGVGFGIRSSM